MLPIPDLWPFSLLATMPRGRKRTNSHPSDQPRAPPQPTAQVPTQATTPMIKESRRQAARLSEPSGRPAPIPTSPIIEIDQTMLMNAIKECARDLSLITSKERLGGLVDNLVALVDHNKDNKDEAGSVRTELLSIVFQLVKEDFLSEQKLYGTFVWQSPKLIRSMHILMVIYLSAMPYKTFELLELLPQLVEFSKSLLVQFKTMDPFHLESHVITLAALYIRIFYAYHKGNESLGEDFARTTVFEILHKYNDNYIWQENPITFLRGLSNSYNLIWTTFPDKEYGNIFDSVSKTSTKDHLKGLYADSVVLGKAPLTDNNSDVSNLDLEYLYTLIEDPSREVKKVDRVLDIMCQIITCNNHNYSVLFPPKEVIEINILPLLYHDQVYIKVRTCHLIAAWVKSFIYRYPYGPDKDAILSSIVQRLFGVVLQDSNLAVQFSISRSIISLLRGPTDRNDWIPSAMLGPVVRQLVDTYSIFPKECSPLLAANLILRQYPTQLKTIHVEVFKSLCNLLRQTCKGILFFQEYGYNVPGHNSRDEVKSLIDTLKGLEVVLIVMKEAEKIATRTLEQCEKELLESLKIIYQEFQDRSLEVTAAALQTQEALQGLICSKNSSIATKQHVKSLRNRIKDINDGELASDALRAANSILAAFRRFP